MCNSSGSKVCHSEGARSATEESLLSAKDSLTETLERQLLCHVLRALCPKNLFIDLLENPSFCHV
ncbi:hypothetical protein [Helicobacter marmotae]|uniref:hypothetical protein n=1 Tax=Helicobacter marmotae TaxID=152490 RepID=UPI0013150F7D|nr:hypothetical protein [Helicobacter marmotae]